MTAITAAHDTFAIERTYDTAVDAVFRAWAEPKLISLPDTREY